MCGHHGRRITIHGQKRTCPAGWQVLPDLVDDGWATVDVGGVVEDGVTQEYEMGHVGMEIWRRLAASGGHVQYPLYGCVLCQVGDDLMALGAPGVGCGGQEGDED